MSDMNCWVIAVACFAINFLILGGARLSPLLFVSTMERFNVDRPEASFPYVLCYFMKTLTGPLIGVSERKFGLQAVTLAGVIVSAVGVGSCFFAEDAFAVTILWGIIYGSGFGFATALLPAIINIYFQENKSKANGFALAGSCVGGFLEPIAAENVIHNFGLSGAYLILCGVILNGIPAAMVLKMPDLKNNPPKENNSKDSDMQIDYNPNADLESEKGKQANNDSKNGVKLLKDVLLTENGDTPPRTELSKLGYINYSFNMEANSEQIAKGKNAQDSKEVNQNNIVFPCINENKHWHPDIFKYVAHSEDYRNHPVLLGIRSTEFDDKPKSAGPEPKKIKTMEANRTSISPLPIENPEKQKSSWESFRVMQKPTFLLMMVTQSLYGFVLAIVWTTVVDFVRDKGIPRDQEVYFMMFLPIGDMFGRLGLGFITDGGYLSQTTFSLFSFICYGLGVLFIAISEGFVLIMLSEFFFAFFSGGLIVVFPGIVNEFIEEDYKTMALASRWLLIAPLTLSISPLIGLFRGDIGSYNGLYYMCSAICFLCCGMVTLIPIFAKRAKEKSEQRKT